MFFAHLHSQMTAPSYPLLSGSSPIACSLAWRGIFPCVQMLTFIDFGGLIGWPSPPKMSPVIFDCFCWQCSVSLLRLWRWACYAFQGPPSSAFDASFPGRHFGSEWICFRQLGAYGSLNWSSFRTFLFFLPTFWGDLWRLLSGSPRIRP